MNPCGCITTLEDAWRLPSVTTTVCADSWTLLQISCSRFGPIAGSGPNLCFPNGLMVVKDENKHLTDPSGLLR